MNVLVRFRHYGAIKSMNVLVRFRHYGAIKSTNVLVRFRHYGAIKSMNVLVRFRHYGAIKSMNVLVRFRHYGAIKSMNVLKVSLIYLSYFRMEATIPMTLCNLATFLLIPPVCLGEVSAYGRLMQQPERTLYTTALNLKNICTCLTTKRVHRHRSRSTIFSSYLCALLAIAVSTSERC